MHPEIVRDQPGTCPICGMALEPGSAGGEEENVELRDMSRRFWLAAALTLPIVLLAMADFIGPPTLTHEETEELAQYLATLRGKAGAEVQPQFADTFPEAKPREP